MRRHYSVCFNFVIVSVMHFISEDMAVVFTVTEIMPTTACRLSVPHVDRNKPRIYTVVNLHSPDKAGHLCHCCLLFIDME